jgi:hypothetical protein
MVVSNSAKPLGYYIGNRDSRVRELISDLVETYGDRLEALSDDHKRVFRAALATYQVMEPIWQPEGSDLTCMEACIAGAGGDDLEVWDDEDFTQFVQDVADNFVSSDIEGLIEALTMQLRG